jgi:hypothetical protein
MTFGLRMVAQMLLMLTSIGVYGTLAALRSPGGVLTSIAVVALLAFAAIVAHELAHAAVAQMVGARVNAIIAFPVRLRFRPRRLELIKRGARHGGDLGGYVSYTLDRIDARRKHAIIAAAGPLANLALAVLAGTMAPWFDHRMPGPGAVQVVVPGDAASASAASPDDVRPVLRAMSTHSVTLTAIRLPDLRPPVWTIILTAFAILSGGLGLANLVPFDGSDGDHILNLWRRRRRTGR